MHLILQNDNTKRTDIKIFYKNIACLKASFIDTCSLLVLASKPLYAIRLITASLITPCSNYTLFFIFFKSLSPRWCRSDFLTTELKMQTKR